MTATETALPFTPIHRIASILDCLINSFVTDATEARVPFALITLIWAHFTRMAERLERIISRGPTPRRVTPAKPKSRTAKLPTPKPPADYGMPTRFGWLHNLAPGMVGMIVSRANLERLLANAETTALIAENPAIGRILRPLCHALGIERPPSLKPPQPEAPTQPKPTRKPPTKTPDPGGIFPPPPPPVAPGSRFWPPWIKIPKTTL